MRISRLICCIWLLVALAAGASEAPSAAGTPLPPVPNAIPDDDDEPQDEEKGPVEQVAPRVETVTEARSVEARETRATTVSGTDQTLGEVRLMTRYTQLHGDASRSFRVQGSNNLAEFNYFAERRFQVNRRVQMLSMYRGTDDRSVDPERNSLQKAYVRFYGPRDEYIFGDGLVSFSRLSFNQNIKGGQGTWQFDDNWKFSVVSGAFIDRYGSLYKDLPGRPYLAFVAGSRLEYKMARESRMGFNFSSSSDRVASLPAAPAGTAPFPTENRVLSLDTRLQLGNTTRLDAEYAYSFTDFDKRAPLGYQGDYGGRIEGTYRKSRTSLRGSYVRYQPNFASINARQIADLQDVAMRASYDLTHWLTVDGTVRRSNNNLRNQLPFQTRLLGPEAKLIFRDLWFYPKMTLEAGYRHRDVQASNQSIDRFVRIPFAEVTVPFGTSFFSFGWERRQAVDLIDAAQTSNANRYFVGLRGMYDLNGWTLNPVMRWELERQSQRPGLKQPVPDFTLLYDSNRLSSAALFVQAPKWFIAEMAYRQSSATIFGPAGYRRPSYRAAVTYKINNDENILFIVSFERNNNFFFTSPDFDERQIGGTFVYKFGRRGQ